jgi:hypothetical protein
MNSKLSAYFNQWVILGSILIAVFLCIFFALMFFLFNTTPAQNASIPAAITIIPAPTLTPTPNLDAQLTATAKPGGGSSSDGITVGMYVQINGTGGDGLHLRESPGTSSKALFIGMEAEVFKVEEGPKDADGYTWWHLVAPYDASRNGWAASKFLVIIAKQQ